jgi:hypothetical protein
MPENSENKAKEELLINLAKLASKEIGSWTREDQALALKTLRVAAEDLILTRVEMDEASARLIKDLLTENARLSKANKA